MAASSTAPRSTLEDFKLVQKIGSGSYGVVWKVVRKVDGGTYALKEVDLFGMSKKEQEECIRETQLLSEFDCEYIIKYWDAFLERGKLYIVMEYAGGGNLHDLIRRSEGPLPEDQIWKLLIQMLLGLHAMHRRSVLHRDLKTLNVFLDERLNVKLGDLGVAKILSNNTLLARTVVGTPYYLSPELCEDQPYGAKSDVWALGVSLYECCMRRHPFDADNQGALVLKILRGRYAPLEGYSRELAAVVDACLTLDPERRPDTAQLLGLSALRDRAAGLGITLPPLPENHTPYLPPAAPGPAMRSSSPASAAAAGVGVQQQQPLPGALVPQVVAATVGPQPIVASPGALTAAGMQRKRSSKELAPLHYVPGGAANGHDIGNGLIRAAAAAPAVTAAAVVPRPPSRPRSAGSPVAGAAAGAAAGAGPRSRRPSAGASDPVAGHGSPRGDDGARRSPSPAAMAQAFASMQVVGGSAPLQPRPPALRTPSQRQMGAQPSVLLQSQLAAGLDSGAAATAALAGTAASFVATGGPTLNLQQSSFSSAGSISHPPLAPSEGSASPRKLAAALRSPSSKNLLLPPLSPALATNAMAAPLMLAGAASSGSVESQMVLPKGSGGLPVLGIGSLAQQQSGSLQQQQHKQQQDRAQQLAVALIEVKAGIAAKVGQRTFEALHELVSIGSFSSDQGSFTSSTGSSTITASTATASGGYGPAPDSSVAAGGSGAAAVVLGSYGSSSLGSEGFASGGAAQDSILAAQHAKLLSPAASNDSSGLLLGDALRAAALTLIPEPAVAEEVMPLLLRLSLLEGQLGAQQLQ